MTATSPRRNTPLTAPTLVLAALALILPSVSSAQVCPWPGLTGSFVQPALADSWTGTQWDQEYDTYMSNACLDQLVLQWTADSKAHTAIYPTTLTVAGYTSIWSQTTMSTGRKLAWSISQRLEMALWRRNIASLTCPELVAATCKSRCSLRALRGLLSTSRRCCNSDCGNIRGKGDDASPSLLV